MLIAKGRFDLHDTEVLTLFRRMTDINTSGPMAMVKIDGGKIKQLREQQGLTQLYLATAVQVTTDTISRWENKRYPTIKKENGLKLADALNVVLEDLLLVDEPTEEPSVIQEKEEKQDSSPPVAMRHPGVKKTWPLILLSAALMVVVVILGWLFLGSTSVKSIHATRILPGQSIPGHPFPVIIEITGISEKPVALIIKEHVPAGASIMSTYPEASSINNDTNEIKWLGKVTEDTIFAYTVSLSSSAGSKEVFHGNAALNKNSEDMPIIEGPNSVTLGDFHWADADQDNVISDKEILSVYDQYADFKEFDLEMDTIEEIWLGSGYKWNTESQQFEIKE